MISRRDRIIIIRFIFFFIDINRISSTFRFIIIYFYTISFLCKQ